MARRRPKRSFRSRRCARTRGPAVHTHAPAQRQAVREYLLGEGRFRHLCEPVEQATVITRDQQDVHRSWTAVAASGGRA